MADIRESFPTLEDGSGVGQPLKKIVEGDATSGANGQLAFGFKDGGGNAILAPVLQSGDAPGYAVPVLPAKDTSGNLIELPVQAPGDAPGNAVPVMPFLDSSGNEAQGNLDASGYLKVVTPEMATGNGLYARGQASGSATLVTVATLALVASAIYENLDFIVSCTRDALFQVIWNDNGAETILAEAIVGSGMPSFHATMHNIEVTAGGTGTQQLLIKAKNLVGASLSDFHASLTVNKAA